MANAVRGQVAVSFGDRELTLSFSVDAICQLEARFPGETIGDFGRRLFEDGSTAFKRAMLWGALRDHHPEIAEKPAGELLAEPGSEALLTGLLQAWAACWPIRRPEDANAPADPPTPPATAAKRAGTGRRSSRSGASSS